MVQYISSRVWELNSFIFVAALAVTLEDVPNLSTAFKLELSD